MPFVSMCTTGSTFSLPWHTPQSPGATPSIFLGSADKIPKGEIVGMMMVAAMRDVIRIKKACFFTRFFVNILTMQSLCDDLLTKTGGTFLRASRSTPINPRVFQQQRSYRPPFQKRCSLSFRFLPTCLCHGPHRLPHLRHKDGE
jgi:hypothetical protein